MSFGRVPAHTRPIRYGWRPRRTCSRRRHVGLSPRWRGIGIRIEDDVLVTEDDPIILTADVPKTVAEIEALMQGAAV